MAKQDVAAWCDRLIAADGKPVGLSEEFPAFPGSDLDTELRRRGYVLGVSGAGWSALPMTPPNPPTCHYCTPETLVGNCPVHGYEAQARAELDAAKAIIREQDAELAELRGRAETLRLAHLHHCYEGELSRGCGICGCEWEAGADEVHDEDCIVRPLPTPPTETK